jgi:hypothetical protein
MPLTRDFKQTIRARAQRDPKFRKELLRMGLEAMLSGDITLAKTILRDYINATVSFSGLAEATYIPPKSLMRMFSPAENIVHFFRDVHSVGVITKEVLLQRTTEYNQWVVGCWAGRGETPDSRHYS